MRKIINGRKYDTSTAKEICSHARDHGSFDYVSERLFRKKNGEFFIYGEGGARSIYSERVSVNTWRGGEKINPVTEEEARSFVEEYGSVDVYEEIFGEVEE